MESLASAGITGPPTLQSAALDPLPAYECLHQKPNQRDVRPVRLEVCGYHLMYVYSVPIAAYYMYV